MKADLKTMFFAVSTVILCLTTPMANPASALTITNSTTFNVTLNDGAYIKQSTAIPSSFNKDLVSLKNTTKEGTVAFSDIPYFTFGDTQYFQFVYDMQETGETGSLLLSIDDIILSVDGVNLWNYDNAAFGSIILNSVEDSHTSTPLGNGGDMELYVPVAHFTGLALTGSSLLKFTVTQSQSDNGPDEWVVLGSGSFFGPDDSIGDDDNGGGQAVVPEPSTLVLLGSGLLGLFYAGRKRNRT